jgi:hypothetical protein
VNSLGAWKSPYSTLSQCPRIAPVAGNDCFSDGDGGRETTWCTLDVLNTTGRGVATGQALEGEGHWEGLAEIWVAVSRVYPMALLEGPDRGCVTLNLA